MRRSSLILLGFLLPFWISAQEAGERILSLTEFHRYVLEYHPVVKQAWLLPLQAQAQLRIARGAFDPVAQGALFHKEYEGLINYSLVEGGLKVPVWSGIELKAAVERNTGPFLNPEDKTPKEGFLYGGISVPLGRDLIIDERRSAVMQAKIFRDYSEADKISAINKIMYKATSDYWAWAEAWNRVQVMQKALRVGEERLDWIIRSIQQGDLPGIDSVEARLEVLSRRQQLNAEEMQWGNQSLQLSRHLWSDALAPVELKPDVRPSMKDWDSLLAAVAPDREADLMFALSAHPDIAKSRFKLEQVKVERRLALNNLLPGVRIEYFPLYDAKSATFPLTADYVSSHYKLGGYVYFPLFLRKERGKYQATRYKLDAASMDLAWVSREIETGVQQSANEVANLELQVKLQEEIITSSGQLLEGEEIRYRNGESSLFLVNRRERAVLEAELKRAEVLSKLGKARAAYELSVGRKPVVSEDR